MNKKYTLLLIILATSFFINAQVTTVLAGTNVDEPNGLLLVGNILYFSEDSRISKFDVTDTSPVPVRTTVISGLDNPTGIEIKDNELYFANYDNSSILKFDITDASPSTTTVTTIGQANRLLIHNDNLYYTDNNGGRVYIHDLLSGSTNSSQIFTSNFSSNDDAPIGIEMKDDFIYVATTTIGGSGKLYRIDINNPVPEELLTGLQRPIGMEFRGNDLYIANRDSDKIVKVDITQNPLIIEDVVDINNPCDITFYNDIMYIGTNSRISKVDLNSLDIKEYEENKKIKLSPNPAKENITISNLKEDKAYTLFDINGRVLKSGTLELSDNNLNVADLAAGTYMLRIEATNFKFIKI